MAGQRMKFDRIEFASRRRKAQDDLIAALEPVVGRALDRKQGGADTWWRSIIDAARPLYDSVVRDDGADPGKAAGQWARLANDLTRALTKTKHVDEYSHTMIATWVAGEILSVATIAAAQQDSEPFELEWISMHDSKVRHTHRDADGQKVKPGEKFRIGDSELRYPGDSTAPLNEWINCRCTLAAVPVHDNTAASVDTGARSTRGEFAMTETTVSPYQTDGTGLLPWHGVLAPEGVWSGDKRKFKEGSLTTRDLPFPLRHQYVDDEGHKGSVPVGTIEYVDKERGDGLMWAGGHMLATSDADQAVGLMADFGRYGVSVDADEAEFDLNEDEDGIEFSHARVSSAAMCAIPAFQEAFVTLGEDPYYADQKEALAASAAMFDSTLTSGQSLIAAISEKSWDGSASRFAPEEYKRSCVLHLSDSLDKSQHKLPIKEPNGDLSRAGVHAAAGRVDGTDAPDDKKAAAKRALRSAYKQLGEDPPEELAFKGSFLDGEEFAADEFGRGPGWLTNPEDTKRIHDYWTVPGEPGYEKVQWGVDGDFNRCRVEVGEEIGENSPEKLRFINQICAQWHHDATGFWPGHAPTETSLETPEGDMAPAISLVASATTVTPPHEWFDDPKLDRLTPFTMEEKDGLIHLFGHVTDRNTCHMAFPGECVTPPRSTNGYRDFLTGQVMTDAGPVNTGPITVNTTHAPGQFRMRRAMAHYDNTGDAVGDVTAGDDEFGTWVNGWVRPWVSAEKVYELRANPPSGDWRKNPNTGDFSMIGVLCVNAPGYPVHRVGIKDGAQVSLVASLSPVETEPETPLDELAEAIAAAIENRQERRQTIAELATVFESEEV